MRRTNHESAGTRRAIAQMLYGQLHPMSKRANLSQRQPFPESWWVGRMAGRRWQRRATRAAHQLHDSHLVLISLGIPAAAAMRWSRGARPSGWRLRRDCADAQRSMIAAARFRLWFKSIQLAAINQ
jgi:hypothetical protein